MDRSGENEAARPYLEGRYTNYFIVGHNAFEFLLDFGRSSPESEKADFHTRIITSPTGAKVLLDMFREAIDQYERTYGPIQSP